jgi:hypothetical protein
MNFAYTCKFCGKPGIVTADEAGLEMFKPEVWIPKICCNRCGAFMEKKRGLEAALVKACRVLQTCRTNFDAEKRQGTETKTRDSIVAISRKFCEMVCNHFRVQTVWDGDFPQMMFDKPEKVGNYIGEYVRSIRKISATP